VGWVELYVPFNMVCFVQQVVLILAFPLFYKNMPNIIWPSWLLMNLSSQKSRMALM